MQPLPQFRIIDQSYVERQEDTRCGGHSLNNLFQNVADYKARGGPLFLTHCAPGPIWNHVNKTYNLCNLCESQFENMQMNAEDVAQNCRNGNDLPGDVLAAALRNIFQRKFPTYHIRFL